MEFKLGDFVFRVNETVDGKIPICACHKKPNSIIFPFPTHICKFNYCSDEEKCDLCELEVDNIRRLIDLEYKIKE